MKKSRIIAVALMLCLLLLGVAHAGGSIVAGSVDVEVSVNGLFPPDTYVIEMTADDPSFPMPEGSSGGVYKLTLNGPGAGKIPQITFDKLGVYTYTIKQLKGNSAFAKSYDATVYHYTVAVTRNTKTNEWFPQAWLTVEGKDTKPDKCSFVNEYLDPTPVDHDPPVKKVIDNVPEGNPSFQFTLTAKSNTVGLAIADMPIPAGGSNGLMTVEVKAGEEREFGVMVFDQEGTYVYEIAEVNTGLEHVTYDTSVYTLTYDITLNKETWKYERNLTISKDGEVVKEAVYTFNNTYEPGKPVEETLKVKKVITGDTPSEASTFKFLLTAKSNTAGLSTAEMPMPSGASGGKATVSVKGGEEKSVGTLAFNQEGTYVYELTEEDTGLSNYTYDKSVYTLTYEIAKENGNFVLKSKKITKDGSEVKDISFSNKYTSSEGSTDTPKTGVQDYWPYLLGGACLLLLAAAIMIIYLRRSRNAK